MPRPYRDAAVGAIDYTQGGAGMANESAIYRMRTLLDKGYTIRHNDDGTLSIIPPDK